LVLPGGLREVATGGSVLLREDLHEVLFGHKTRIDHREVLAYKTVVLPEIVRTRAELEVRTQTPSVLLDGLRPSVLSRGPELDLYVATIFRHDEMDGSIAVRFGSWIASLDVEPAATDAPPIGSIEHLADIEDLLLRRQDRAYAADVLHAAQTIVGSRASL